VSVEVVKKATPVEFSVLEPRVVEPSLKLTVQVGMLPLLELTVALNVIGWP
jgi:hypothetical protein